MPSVPLHSSVINLTLHSDINLGCPQRCAKEGGYGAYACEDQENVFKMVNTLHLNLKVPVCCKIRMLDSLDYDKVPSLPLFLALCPRVSVRHGPSYPFSKT